MNPAPTPNAACWAGAAAAMMLAACQGPETGPVRVVAIGAEARLANPNLEPLSPGSSILLEATAQGLVAFDADGEIEPGLAQSWIVSDDGQRYTFRLRPARWHGGGAVTAEEVARRIAAAVSGASRNPLKPVLGAITEVTAMTDRVLEIELAGPRPHFLQLLAQPEMAILRSGRGTGPQAATAIADGWLALRPVPDPLSEEEELEEEAEAAFLVRPEPAARAIAAFGQGEADLVAGGTIGDLPLAQSARLPGDRLRFDPVVGLLGFVFTSESAFADAATRDALSMAIDRGAIATRFRGTGLRPRTTLAPLIRGELSPTSPAWEVDTILVRRARARALLIGQALPPLRIAMSGGAGYRLLFAHLRRDFALVGVEARLVPAGDPSDLVLVDAVAPALLASWYLRRFTCGASPICDPAADIALEAARRAATPADRIAALAEADRLISAQAPYIVIGSPVRWSLVSPRLTGFGANRFAHHPLNTLILEPR